MVHVRQRRAVSAIGLAPFRRGLVGRHDDLVHGEELLEEVVLIDRLRNNIFVQWWRLDRFKFVGEHLLPCLVSYHIVARGVNLAALLLFQVEADAIESRPVLEWAHLGRQTLLRDLTLLQLVPRE